MSARPSPGPSARPKPPHPPVGIAAGAEDAKYQTKYRELKRKVREIETDNDKLHFKVLQAKRSIQRMKLERAILYERLAPPPDPGHAPPAPPQAPVPPFPRPRQDPEYALPPRLPAAYPAPRMPSPPRRTPADEPRHMPPPHASPPVQRSSTRPRQPYMPPALPTERSRHPDPHPHPRLSSFMPRLSPPPDSRRVHALSPAPPLEYDYPREFEHPRPAAAAASPSMGHRTRQPAYYAYAPHSRSGSPVSGSGSAIGNGSAPTVAGGGDISRPDSRHYYEPHERGARAFKLRPVNPPNDEMDFVHEDGRSRDRGGGFDVPRKRARNEMDVDDDAAARLLEDRGKRYREHRPSIDNQEDGRIGPP
ncbi:hypothetical protein C0993_008464 [Termitomyces sp. T159_Od127]|nr:hypothetical protein C0993_008464 [Termitomyces sp. T159_Od127]